ncbi:MAG TPA: glycoside hydrolase family 18 protein [Anaerolineales bacterium]|nr:glycoside hydrolase family 18 protein [Anaerolineales bacterium]
MKIQKPLLRLFGVAGVVAMLTMSLVPAAGAAPRNDKEIVGYFIEWGIYGRQYLVKDIVTSGSAGKLTVINYAFANAAPDASGQVVCKLFDEWADYQVPWTAEQSVNGEAVSWPNPILGNFQQLKALKEMYPNIKVLISVGGWTGSKYFSDAALTPSSRQAFVKSCVDMFIKGDLPDPGWGGMGGPGAAAGVFDGIDIDWEYPAYPGNPGNIIRPEDTENFTELLKEFRAQLDEIDPSLLLTVATPAGEARTKINLDDIHPYLDFINVMTYDFHGGWDRQTGFLANLYLSQGQDDISVDNVVRYYLDQGVPPGKLVVGAPFYSRGWTGVADQNHGLFQPATGPAAGTWEAGSEDYKILQARLAAGETTRYWDDAAKAAWLFDGTDFWTYDDPQTFCYKTAYIRHNKLRGVMFWELSGDTPDGELISAIDLGLHRPGQGWGYGHCK